MIFVDIFMDSRHKALYIAADHMWFYNNSLLYDFYPEIYSHGIVGLAAGFIFQIPILSLAGIILFGHSAMDRIFGYGLKYPDDFKHTHLGWIGRKK